MFWFKLSVIIFVPHEAMKKKPTVIAQHIIIGRLGSNRCKDSAVAQQLTAAKEKKPIIEKILRNLFSFMVNLYFAASLHSRHLITFFSIPMLAWRLYHPPASYNFPMQKYDL